MTEKYVLAVDLGAESGRVMCAGFDGQRIEMTEVHRFSNTPVYANGTLYWDALRLWHNIQIGIRQAAAEHKIASIGVDSWGVNPILLDNNGHLLSNPVHYRDNRTDGAMSWVFERMPRREVYERTGIQFMQMNGLYQLASMVRDNSSQLKAVGTLLSICDLFNYWLTGTKKAEFTMATTMQLCDPRTKDWDRALFEAIGFPLDTLVPIVEPGEPIGTYEGIPVIASAGHDTGAAVVGIPTTTQEYAYLSSGTWSLLGLELDHPVINDAAYEANLTNEGGYAGTIRLLKNIMGLWIAQQCRNTWAEAGRDYSYDDLVRLAQSATPFQAFVDPDVDDFFHVGDMPEKIRAYCRRTGQMPPESDAQMIRTVYESLALKYRLVLEHLIAVSGQSVERLHVIGGGTNNALLCQMTANAIDRPVIAGPAEATALGNAVVQLIAQGELANLAEARAMLAESIDTVTYEPQDSALWIEQAGRLSEQVAATQQ